MRYTLHDANGNKLGESETAQGIGNIATHGTFSFDSNPNRFYPFTVYEQENGHIVGHNYECETHMTEALRKLK
jgi:hypothetical protein